MKSTVSCNIHESKDANSRESWWVVIVGITTPSLKHSLQEESLDVDTDKHSNIEPGRELMHSSKKHTQKFS
jgi:hypothetical protein